MSRLDERLHRAADDMRHTASQLAPRPAPSRSDLVWRRVATGVVTAIAVAAILLSTQLLSGTGPTDPTVIGDPTETTVPDTDPSVPTTTSTIPTTSEPTDSSSAMPEHLVVATGAGVGLVDASTGEMVTDLVTEEMGGMGVGFGPAAWAPGREVAYVTMVIGAHLSEIHAVELDGSGSALVATGSDPAVSPDGTKLAYTKPVALEEGSGDALRERLVVRNLDSGEERSWQPASQDPGLIADLRSLSWAPDSTTLAFEVVFEDGSEIRILDTTQGSSVLDSTQLEPPEGVAWVTPAYRGDTEMLVVTEQGGGLDPAIDPEQFSIVEVDPARQERVAALVQDIGRPVRAIDFDSTGSHMLFVVSHSEPGSGEVRPPRLFTWDGELRELPVDRDPVDADW